MTIAADRVERALAARLVCEPGRPLAVAFSGGGDSLALLLIARAWADRLGRPVVALTVDHRLQAQSGDWAAWCAARAAALGVAHEVLVWEGPKPARGLPAAARQARHRLIAGAARRAGARVVLFGHTADDVMEAQWMSRAGLNISAPTAWSPSPVWPQGRDLFILRPLLSQRRAALRAWLASRGEPWINDPANEDTRQPRARARAALSDATAPVADPFPPHLTPTFAAMVGPSGEIILDESIVSVMVRPRARNHDLGHIGAAVACASGGEQPPRRDALERLADRLDAGERVNATLGGARVVRTADQLIFVREIGDSRGRSCRPMALAPGERLVWDGRFEVRATAPGLTLAPLRGHAAKLDAAQRRKLSALHPTVRAALPTVIDESGDVCCPTLAADPRIEIKGLVFARMAGAVGGIDSEARIGVYDAPGEEGP